jgi:hypothetical protein
VLVELRRSATAGVSESCAGNATVCTPSVSTTVSSPSRSASENASPIVCTGPAGTPAAVSSSRHSSRVRAASRSSIAARTWSRCRTRLSFVGEPRELAVVAGEDHQVAVRGSVGRKGLDARVRVAEPLW